MSVSEQVKKDYDQSAGSYDQYNVLPSGRLESQLVMIGLGDCKGLTVLDLGGGTGLHAREAVDLGATAVDIVDVSSEMLKVAETVEQKSDRKNVIRVFEADVSQPLSHLPLRKEGYDVVMANWVFSFADSIEVLRGMFHNVATYLKPGGHFVGVRDNDPYSPALDGRYGGSCKWVKEIPGGVKYLCVLHSTPPVEFEGYALKTIYSGSTEMYEAFGLTNITIVPYEQAQTVKQDPEFWKLFLEHPCFAVVRAKMRNIEEP